MNLVKLVLALLFGGKFISACENGHHSADRSRGNEANELSADKQLFGDEDDEGW